jgi:F0F1-type ATP synthase membrane subunit c/vacuolar-type H+-ATPase subunit K
VRGSVVDIRFDARLPPIYSLLHANNGEIAIEVLAQLDRRQVRGIFSILAAVYIAGVTTGFGAMQPALAEGRAVATAMSSLAQQPDASATITRTLFVGLAMIESTAIYCFAAACAA